MPTSWRRRAGSAASSSRCWKGLWDSSDKRRLSVSLIDVADGHEAEFLTLATHIAAALIRKDYGHAEAIRDEASPLRYYMVRYWINAGAAEKAHRDAEIQSLTARVY